MSQAHPNHFNFLSNNLVSVGTHPLLEQVPLTVSPFVNLPSATTLPYTYKTMPSTLPPSATGITSSSTDSNGTGDAAGPPSDSPSSNKPKYVVSASGHAAHPDDIIASCRALQAHIARMQADADAELRAFDERIRARDLAEKRRVAPGWLDSDARMLEPERVESGGGGEGDNGREKAKGVIDGRGAGAAGAQDRGPAGGATEMSAVPDEGEELDRAFGVMRLGR